MTELQTEYAKGEVEIKALMDKHAEFVRAMLQIEGAVAVLKELLAPEDGPVLG